MNTPEEIFGRAFWGALTGEEVTIGGAPAVIRTLGSLVWCAVQDGDALRAEKEDKVVYEYNPPWAPMANVDVFGTWPHMDTILLELVGRASRAQLSLFVAMVGPDTVRVHDQNYSLAPSRLGDPEQDAPFVIARATEQFFDAVPRQRTS